MHGQQMTRVMIIYGKNETLRIGKREKNIQFVRICHGGEHK